MNTKDAVYLVLKEASEPLHYREITEQLLTRNLWESKGNTPWATVNAQIAVDIKKNGEKSRFIRVRKGIFTINPEYREHSEKTKEKITVIGTKPVTVSFTNAAEIVLEKYSKREPMHYRKITEIALDKNLVRTSGKTPDATMYAQILTEIQRIEKRGEQPRFMKLGKGKVALSKWYGKGLHFKISEHNRKIRKKLLDSIKKMNPSDFEALISRLLTAIGFEDVEVTPRSHDKGIDVRGTLVVGDVIRTRMAVQAKRWKGNVHSPVIQQVRGSLGAHEQGLIITTSRFGKGARNEAARDDATPIGLMDGEQFVKLLVENDIGVKRSDYKLLDLNEAGLIVENDE